MDVGVPVSISAPLCAIPHHSTCLHVLAPHTCLDECGFFKSLVVRLPHNLIFSQFWVILVFYSSCIFLLQLCKEARQVYLCLCLDQKSLYYRFFLIVFFPSPFIPLTHSSTSTPSPPSCNHHTVVRVRESFLIFAQSLHLQTTPSVSCQPALYL